MGIDSHIVCAVDGGRDNKYEKRDGRRNMIQIRFEKGRDNEIVCHSTDQIVEFLMNQEKFENREQRFCREALLFDGYSVWFKNAGNYFRTWNDFSLTFIAAPISYADQGDGLFSFFDLERKEGLYVQLQKQGKIQVGFGSGWGLFTFHSINANVVKKAFNIITVVFRQVEGWCDLYVNGILSNRKQFPRHMCLKWPQTDAYLGKYVDNMDYKENAKAGCFYGFMRDVFLHGRALSDREVKELHSAHPVEEVAESVLPDRKVYEGDVQRPVYHLIAPGKWMNEPHAPFYFQGYYHIFYQANPHAPTWNHIQWGHMVSKDMVHWKDMPPALEPDDEHLDPDGCWSGSALVDKAGIPHIFYTAGNDGRFPNQSVAMATADVHRGETLPEWDKHPDPVVVQSEGWLGEFRDPYVWLEGDTYFMLVGTGDQDNGGGNAVLYSGTDLLHWQSWGFTLDYDYDKNQELGHVWELPVLLPLRDESGVTVCHILLVCACQIEGAPVETYGFLGKWDPEGRKFTKFHERAMLLDLGNGTFTGPSGFVTPDLRSVMFTIAQGKRDGEEAFYSGWAHNGGLPVELFIRNKEFHIRPVREIHTLRQRRLLHLENVSVEEADRHLEEISGNSFWMKISADAERLILETADENRSKQVFYDRGRCRFGAMDESGKEIGKYRGAEDSVDIKEEPVTMEYFLDHSMIEVYLNEKKSITLRNYIEGNERKLRISGEVQKIRELELWEMGSAYGDKGM